ncbi:exonuclease SbcC [Geothermobacter ehrlichii]|uniref:Exonuclease SbcC n=1 Tax=Geothermobacter ehrlichii TaxID=213224 RepID=A0A5D3WHZ7_9BACT|nr:SMC family ATPase [Geothermobacter ehrlichii]TYO97097.1 exonuclease SbcC [Geothermobacter ehrlichii]
MRPLRLVMTAFGPFPGSETVDFTALGENPLFLINGPTGAGKTSILDAICFALYGRTTGDEREGNQMRCDLAPVDRLTEVVFEFELASRRYRIRRLPEQQRPKSRGTGFTTQAPQAELCELVDGGQRVLVASKVSEATRTIEELTGLSVDQFRQVMVLPQGRFRQLLMADSGERERIFSRLFATGIYRRIEERLKAEAATIRKQRDDLVSRCQEILVGADVESSDELEREIATLEPQVATTCAMKDQREREWAEAARQLEQARSLEEGFRNLDQATAALRQLEARAEEMTALRRRLQLADKALRLKPLVERRQACRRDLTDGEKQVAGCRRQLQAAEKELQHSERELARVTGLQARLERAKKEADRLQGYRQRVATLDRARRKLRAAERDEAVTRLRLDRARFATCRQLERQRRKLAADLERQRHQLQEKEALGKNLKTEVERQERNVRTLELAWHRGQAAILAAELAEGAPCPVCGSREHPAPARSEQPLPSQQEIEQARDRLAGLRKQLEQAREAYREARERIAGLQLELERVAGELEAAGPTDIDRLETDLRQRADELGLGPEDEDSAETAIAEREAAVDRARLAVTAARAALAAAEREVPEAYRETERLDEELAATQEEIAGLEKEISRITGRQQQAREGVKAARSALEQAGRQHARAQQELAHAERELAEALAQSPFDDEEAWQQALCDEATCENLRQQLAAHDTAVQQNEGIRRQLEKQLAGRERPDLGALQIRLDQAESEKKRAQEDWRRCDQRLQQLLAARKRLHKNSRELAELDRRYRVTGTLSDVANGQTGRRISLQRFVLSVLLDDVLVEASRRLHLMSRGRYRLLRREDKSKGNRASGLDLEVEDAYTGKTRPVATLSGGESFMAALSLALGLSDVVQAHAGGIRLDTLFIDEGFGSLDTESLDLAVRTLIDLQSSGRMIGIISHVAELKEQIGLRIDVSSSRLGSSLRLVVP